MKSRFMKLAIRKGPKENTEHVWGNYQEILLSNDVMSRIIKFYEGGATSVHRHPVDEIIFIELGKVAFLCGKNPKKLRKKVYGAGSLIFIPAEIWHSIGCFNKISKKLPFALGVEYIFGKIKDGKYKIHKTLPAVKAIVKDR